MSISGIPRASFLALPLLAITLTAACAHSGQGGPAQASPPAASSSTQPTSTMAWNDYAWDLIARNQIGQFPSARTFAYMNLAINNALVMARDQGRKSDGAAAGAAATVLAFMLPKEEKAIESRLAGEMAAIGTDGRQDFAAGVEIGRTTAASVITWAKEDRTGADWSGSVPVGPDKWASQLQPPKPPIGPQLGGARPFFMATGSEFRPASAPAFDSPEFKAAVAEVRQVSDTRTNGQLRIAQSWENLTGAYAAGLWNQVARGAISAHGLDEATSARILAMMHMVGVDAFIACHDAKYTYWVPRPTQVDPGIRLAISIPNHPSYPSNHACISGSMGLVLDQYFPDQGGRYFAMGRQAGESRIYAGIHYRFDLDEGYGIARKLSAKALATGIPVDRPFAPLGR